MRLAKLDQLGGRQRSGVQDERIVVARLESVRYDGVPVGQDMSGDIGDTAFDPPAVRVGIAAGQMDIDETRRGSPGYLAPAEPASRMACSIVSMRR